MVLNEDVGCMRRNIFFFSKSCTFLARVELSSDLSDDKNCQSVRCNLDSVYVLNVVEQRLSRSFTLKHRYKQEQCDACLSNWV